MEKVILASSNPGKLREFEHLFSKLSLDIISQADMQVTDAEETGTTFVENAIIKARHACASTGLPAIADDSGVVIPALNGEPGVYSARYAGEHGDMQANLNKVIAQLVEKNSEDKSIIFHCCLVLMKHADDPTPIICEADWFGEYLLEPRGVNGFGYDPIFYLPEYQCSAAELDQQLKAKICHRGQALEQLLQRLSSLGYN